MRNTNNVIINTQCYTNDYIDNDMRDWILLDNQSTIDLFCNKKLLTGIHKTDEPTEVVTNGRIITVNLKGHLDGYGEVWYYKDAITNILGMANVMEKYPISFDSEKGNVFIVQRDDGNWNLR